MGVSAMSPATMAMSSTSAASGNSTIADTSSSSDILSSCGSRYASQIRRLEKQLREITDKIKDESTSDHDLKTKRKIIEGYQVLQMQIQMEIERLLRKQAEEGIREVTRNLIPQSSETAVLATLEAVDTHA